MNKVKVVVFVDGDRVEQVLADFPIDVVVVNNDIEGIDDEEIISVLGEDSYVLFTMAEAEEDLVHQVFMDVRG